MSKQTRYPKVKLLGVEIDALTINQAINYILERAADHTQPATYVVKPYVEFLDQAAGDPALRQLLNEAELALPDGVALLWAAAFLYNGRRSRWRFWITLAAIVLRPGSLRRPLPERIAGINFTWPLLQRAARDGISVFLIGKNTPAAIEATVTAMQIRLPELDIVGWRCGRDPARPLGEVREGWLQEALTAIQRHKPDLILVGMGFPLQERVISRLASQLDHGVLIGEGGTFDYEIFGGQRRKAPGPIQAVGLEWLWRLILEPSRFQRQLAVPRYIRRIWRARRQT